jgi:hypothetical protein
MSFSKIYKALNNQLDTVSGLPVVQHENDAPHKNDIRQGFVRSTLLPAETITSTLGEDGVNELHGLFQIDLFNVINEGPYSASDLADTIIEAFDRTTRLTYLGVIVIVQQSWRGASHKFDTHYMTPVTVRWSAFI